MKRSRYRRGRNFDPDIPEIHPPLEGRECRARTQSYFGTDILCNLPIGHDGSHQMTNETGSRVLYQWNRK